MLLDAQDLEAAYEFAAKRFNDCDELVNNRVRWGNGSVPAVQ